MKQREGEYTVNRPRVVLGLPVFNGARYLRQTLESLLAQTVCDLRVVIGDNASTDETEALCREYAATDERIRYFRHPRNMGVAPNLNFVFQPGEAPYFKWAGHDDLLEPEYLERCLEVLEARPEVVVVQSRTIEIDETGAHVRTYDDDIRLEGRRPRDRLWSVLWIRSLNEFYGVMRADTMRRTRAIGSFVNHDRNFMAEMLLRGQMAYVEDYLFKRRMHAAGYTGGVVAVGREERVRWQDSNSRVPLVHEGLINLRRYAAAAVEVPPETIEKLACLRVVASWGLRRAYEVGARRGDLMRDRIARQHASIGSRVT